MKYARQALEFIPEDDPVRYVQATSIVGLAEYTSGDLEAAERSLSEFCMNLQKTGEIPTLIGITFLLADIRVTLGRLQEMLKVSISNHCAIRLTRESPHTSERQTCIAVSESFTLN